MSYHSRCFPMLLTAIIGCTSGDRAAEEPITSSIPDAILGEALPPQGQAVTYMEGDAETRGYLAVPEGDGPFPALILIHEWNGLADRVRQVADAFADEGYVALAADLYRGRTGSNRDENMALVQETQANMDMVIANLDAAQRFLRNRPDVTGKVGVMGWCFGGGIALSYALGGEQHDATAIFYGSLIEDPAELARLDHPVYGTFAEMDQGIPPDQVERFAAALDSIGIENDIHVYDAVNHGFWLRVDEDRELREAPATDAWSRLQRFLAQTIR
ncbi:MAG: dienelactone hydrolase family protein [Gemmatimonadales bacterium]|jgi:carboxymethylenebutenolidase